MQVANQIQQIGVLVAEDCFIATLKQMTNRLVLAVEVERVALLQPLHQLGQRRLACFEKQVDVIPHQHVGVQPKAVPVLIPAEQFKLAAAVKIGAKDLLALVAAGNHMVESTREVDSGPSCHGLRHTTSRL